MKIENKIEELVEPIVKDLGFEIEYVEFAKEGTNNVLRVVIDKVGEAMWVEDCEKVSRAIEDIVDKNINQEYVLEVSSPGLERQLKNIKLYKKYIGKNIHVKLFTKVEGKKEFEGIIKDVDEDKETVMLELEDKNNLELLLKDIASAYTTYDFDTALKGNTDNVNLNKLNKFNKNN